MSCEAAHYGASNVGGGLLSDKGCRSRRAAAAVFVLVCCHGGDMRRRCEPWASHLVSIAATRYRCRLCSRHLFAAWIAVYADTPG